VHGIVGKADGHIAVSSTLGQGTVFEIRWPAVADAEQPQSDRVQPVSLAGNGETVLVAEDEPGVRKSTGRILSRNGYHVIAASGGQAALDELRCPGRRVDLLLSDAVMPDMSGPQLVEGARALQPGLRVLLMSGYGHDVMGSQTAVGDAPLLKKPFAANTLLASVREALTSAPAPSQRQ
jgi:DNA-binding NtrC family response regulator